MKVLLVTPLYPPDVAVPAPYMKELATRLAKEHEITVATYGTLPEEVPGVTYHTVNARLPLIRRVVSMTRRLMTLAPAVDVVFVENGASVELPILLTRVVTRTPIVFHLGDERALAYGSRHILYGTLTRLVRLVARTTIITTPPERPEILPFTPHPTESFTVYDSAWTEHLALIRTALSP